MFKEVADMAEISQTALEIKSFLTDTCSGVVTECTHTKDNDTDTQFFQLLLFQDPGQQQSSCSKIGELCASLLLFWQTISTRLKIGLGTDARAGRDCGDCNSN
jgi:hypothetical protein